VGREPDSAADVAWQAGYRASLELSSGACTPLIQSRRGVSVADVEDSPEVWPTLPKNWRCRTVAGTAIMR